MARGLSLRGLQAGPAARAGLPLAVLLLALLARPAAAFTFGNTSRGWAEIVSWQPRAILLHGFLTDHEADHIVELAEHTLERSRVVDKDGQGKLDSVRTSSGTFLSKSQTVTVADVEERVSQATHLPVSHAENLQVLKYELEQEYKAHWDVIEVQPNSSVGFQQVGNPRIATLLMYLSDVEEGGETSFPAGRWINAEAQQQPPYTACGAKGVSVKPKKGDAILFYSLKIGTEKKDPFSLHAGCPVMKGTKYSATSWIHVAPYSTSGKTEQQTRSDFGACQDRHPKCAEWAKQGECTRNPIFMKGSGTAKGHCRLSCKVCRVCKAGDLLCQRENERPVPVVSASK